MLQKSFVPQSQQRVEVIISMWPPKTCSLDPLPTSLLKDPKVLSIVLPIITTMINSSLAEGVVPSVFKNAQVTPLLKKTGLDMNNFKNYRPVSNIPFLGKVMEKVVAKQLIHHMRDHDLQDDLQSAYRSGCSTETALLKIKSDMDQFLDEGDDVLLVLLDLSAAFDTIDHDILLERLEDLVSITGVAQRLTSQTELRLCIFRMQYQIRCLSP
jgi:hypothetical protein